MIKLLIVEVLILLTALEVGGFDGWGVSHLNQHISRHANAREVGIAIIILSKIQ